MRRLISPFALLGAFILLGCGGNSNSGNVGSPGSGNRSLPTNGSADAGRQLLGLHDQHVGLDRLQRHHDGVDVVSVLGLVQGLLDGLGQRVTPIGQGRELGLDPGERLVTVGRAGQCG